jgi:hypothetical protein
MYGPVVQRWTGLPGMAQNATVTGKVTSAEDGAALPGVTVLEKGTTNGTSTDAGGNYRISVGDNATLVFSFIGMSSQEVAVGSKSTLDVKMASDVSTLSEVIVTGYTTQNQREVSGSVSAVRGEQISRIPLATFDQALQGQVPGVLIQAQSGQPGAALRCSSGARVPSWAATRPSTSSTASKSRPVTLPPSTRTTSKASACSRTPCPRRSTVPAGPAA